ncbi:MAG: ABC transporter permease [Turicibacter sp.]|nr:ABC transporter permease [Turicibacter sp.]
MNFKNLKTMFAENSSLFAFILILIVSIFLQGTTFFNIQNISNVLLNNATIGIIALGMTLIIISGGIDLAVGAQLASTGIIAIAVANNTGSVILGILAAIAAGMAMGLLSGTIISKFGIPAFIATLGLMQIYRSIAQHQLNGGGILVDRELVGGFLYISNTRILEFGNFPGIPLPVIYWLVLAVVVHIVANKTSFGRHIYAIGSNEKAANLSGINIHRVKLGVYMLSGALVAVASIIEASRLGAMNSAVSGTMAELDAIAAVVIGGTAMSGGKGKISGTVFGMLTLAVINNMMNLMGMPPFFVAAIRGGIIILAVMLQRSVSAKEKQY